jgi:hypothetical protein
MTWAEIFDLVRHVAELFFYVVTGPLLGLFAFNQLRRQRRLDQQLLEVQLRLRQLQAYAQDAREIERATLALPEQLPSERHDT